MLLRNWMQIIGEVNLKVGEMIKRLLVKSQGYLFNDMDQEVFRS